MPQMERSQTVTDLEDAIRAQDAVLEETTAKSAAATAESNRVKEALRRLHNGIQKAKMTALTETAHAIRLLENDTSTEGLVAIAAFLKAAGSRLERAASRIGTGGDL